MRTSSAEHILEMGHASKLEIGITLHILESASQAVLSQDTPESDLVKINYFHILLKQDQGKHNTKML